MCLACYLQWLDKTNPEYRERRLAKKKEAAKPIPKELARDYWLRSKYGITQAEYDTKLDEQRGLCAICDQSSPYNLFVDHCHTTGKVRKLLCASCNTAVGYYETKSDLMEKIRDYLTESD